MNSKFENIKSQTDSCKTLEELFELWKKAHEFEDDWEQSTIEGIEKDSFNKDGYINENKYENSKIKILFILKETNITDYKKENEKPYERNQIGWYQKFLNHEENDNIPKQKEKMGRMAFYINNKDFSKCATEQEYFDALESSAFMNINKRGGSEDTDDKKFNNYVERYEKFFIKQIELINPDYIIIVGRTAANKFIHEKFGEKVFTTWHTAYGMQNQKRHDNPKYAADKNVDCYIRHFFDVIK